MNPIVKVIACGASLSILFIGVVFFLEEYKAWHRYQACRDYSPRAGDYVFRHETCIDFMAHYLGKPNK